ncbi:hypothetical protein ACS0TY_018252 [Phlomoides rotata]
MITRHRGGQLEPLDLDIEAPTRRNRGQNRRERESLRKRGVEKISGDNREGNHQGGNGGYDVGDNSNQGENEVVVANSNVAQPQQNPQGQNAALAQGANP